MKEKKIIHRYIRILSSQIEKKKYSDIISLWKYVKRMYIYNICMYI